MLSKKCQGNPTQWYNHFAKVQQILNNTSPRSTKITPFRILTGLNMRLVDYPDLHGILKDLEIVELNVERDSLRQNAHENIEKIQKENCKTFNQTRKVSFEYNIGDLVAIKKTQFGVATKLRPKYLGPYKVVAKLNHDRYEVGKVENTKGPKKTTTVAENMKRWT